jgi:hypothetical protein
MQRKSTGAVFPRGTASFTACPTASVNPRIGLFISKSTASGEGGPVAEFSIA